MRIDALPVGGAPHGALTPGERVGLLGIDHATRRRNRLNGRIAAIDEGGFEVRVEQSFGNCPRYIQTRAVSLPAGDGWRVAPVAPARLDTLAGALGHLIARADHFYVASHHVGDPRDARHGADVSHRGGRPGFVRVRDNALIEFPDFAGNRFYNTLGNIEASGRAGLLFIDFAEGSLFSLSGEAAIDWDPGSASQVPGAQRIVRIELQQARAHAHALPIRWRVLEHSPALEGTGVWAGSGR